MRDRKTLNELKRKLNEADITLRNNTSTLMVLKSNVRGGTTYSIEPYDSITVSFEDLQSLVRKSKRSFETFSVIIEDVYCTDAEFDLEEVLEVVGLSRVMKNLDEMPNEFYFDSLLLDESFEMFKEEVNRFNYALTERITERAIYLFNLKEFSDSYKMSFLEGKVGVENIFEDVERSKKDIRNDVDII